MTAVMIPGVSIAMGGQDWLVPPLTLGHLKRLWPKIQALRIGNLGEKVESFDTIVDIATTALQRNYPDMTPGMMEELLDTGNMDAVLVAIMTGSGLKTSGEALAVGTKADGVTSMAFSPPPADTLIP